jgi:hypothetical protein
MSAQSHAAEPGRDGGDPARPHGGEIAQRPAKGLVSPASDRARIHRRSPRPRRAAVRRQERSPVTMPFYIPRPTPIAKETE